MHDEVNGSTAAAAAATTVGKQLKCKTWHACMHHASQLQAATWSCLLTTWMLWMDGMREHRRSCSALPLACSTSRMHCLQVALSASFESGESVAISCCKKLPGRPSSEGREPSAAAASLVRLVRRMALSGFKRSSPYHQCVNSDMRRSSEKQLVDDVPSHRRECTVVLRAVHAFVL
jgi:hypothetical protein